MVAMMVANIRGYTPNYNFKLINFDTPRWHTLEYANWSLLDSLMLSTGTPPLRGEWQNNTSYIVGDRVFDPQTSELYRCLFTHNSAPTGTFAEDRALRPAFWVIQTLGVPYYAGPWQANHSYTLGDIALVDPYHYYLCVDAHVSSPAFATDNLKWTLVFSGAATIDDANAAAAAAHTSADAALVSQNAAKVSADASAASATAAAGSVDDVNHIIDGFAGTSTTLQPVGTGVKSFTTQTNKQFKPGNFCTIIDADNFGNAMFGQITVYSGTTLTVNVTGITGSGLLANWIIYISGAQGGVGPQGPQGIQGIPGVKGDTGSQGPAGTGAGDMLRSANLSDVANVTTARNNLLAAPITSPTFLTSAAAPTPAQTSNDTSIATTAFVKTLVGGSGVAQCFIGEDPPPTPSDNMLWWESSTGLLYVRYNDGNGPSQWVIAAPIPDITTLVLRTGDTMTGMLTLYADPTVNLHAATKQYVDNKVADTSWVVLVDAPTIIVPGGASGGIGRNFKLPSMAGNRTLGYLQTPVVGTDGMIAIKQDATGSRTLTGLTSNGYCCDGDVAFALGVVPNKWSVMSYLVVDATHTLLQLVAVNVSLG
jgi:hypothetical protein